MSDRSSKPAASRAIFVTTLMLFVLAASYAALIYLPAPFAWAQFFTAVALFTAMRATHSSAWRALWLNAAMAVLSLAGFETYLHLKEPPARQDSVETLDGEPQSMSEPHELLGYAPVKGQQGIWSRRIGDVPVFHSRYSIDGSGLRSMPTATSSDLPCVFFFGGSYTFGSGVNDDETTSHLVAKKFADKFRVFNFGYRGYGPHQMLAALEHNIYANDLNCQPQYVIYQMMPDHVSRAAGFASWDTDGPKFEVNDLGDAVQTGTFEKVQQSSPNGLEKLLNRSLTYQRLTRFLEPKPDESSANLTYAILKRSRDIVRERNPGSKFYVIYWPADQSLQSLVISQLESDNFDLYSINEILPDLTEHNERYRLHQYDGHPNRLAHSLIADFIAREILID